MKKTFFTKDPSFYRSFFKLMTVIALQNLVAYSVNMLDNIMLGSYSQNALSGAATVNQIYFIVNQIALAIGNALIAISSQYWGSHQTKPIRKITKAALLFSLAIAAGIIALCIRIPNTLIGLFTTSPDIIREGTIYLHIIQWTFLFFMISNLLLAMLRSVETVKIAFLISVISLLVNGGINYILIFGRFGAPEMGIQGAAIGTFAARILELGIVLFYVWKKDTKVKLFDEKFRDGIIGKGSGTVWKTFFKVCIPILTSGLLWAVSLPMQTAILGHLSADAIAANSVSSTFFQYLKVIVIAIAGASAVVIGKDIGSNDEEKVRCNGRTLSVLYLAIGLLLGTVLFLLRSPLLSMYRLTPQATLYADHFMIIMSVIMVGMSYQMPVGVGIIQGGGDTKFSMYLNLISVWCIVMPLSFLAAFYWKLPVELVVIAVQSDQIFKCLPIFLRFKSYKWIHKLTAID